MKKISLLLASFIFLIASCSKDNDTLTYTPIEGDINIQLVENLVAKKFEWECKTAAIYGCANFEIDAYLLQNGNNITVEFKRVIEYDICATAFGPARKVIDFGNLPVGSYNLTVKVEHDLSQGTLVVTPDYFALTLNDPKRLNVSNPTLNRIPENTIWGKIDYYSDDNLPIVQSFLDSLGLLGATERNYLAGDYNYFRIMENGEVLPPHFDGITPNPFYVRYVRQYTGEIAPLQELMRQYTRQNMPYISLELHNGAWFHNR